MIAGVDVGIHSVHYSLWNDSELVSVHSIEPNLGARNVELYHLSYVLGQALSHCERVFIEQTLVGNNVKYSIKLSETAGAIMARLAFPEVFQVQVGHWKKGTVGNGNASKDAVTMWLEETYPAYAAECGSQDQRDAVCIGLYGLSLGATSEGIAAALAG